MNKFVKGLICAGVACTMLTAVGCRSNSLDPERRQLQLATAALDGNFNPFFYTSLNDGNIIGNTQIPMITTDEKGNLVCGEDEATVALDWTKVKYADENGSQELPSTATLAQTDHTTYEFLIKKGIKYSNGADLTIKDVLFNIYVYLDPAYTGSATLYSVDIKGLNAYRMQRPNAADGDLVNTDTQFTGAAQQRILNLINWSAGRTESYSAEDLAKVKESFKKEIESDWTSIESSWKESYKYSYRFTETWEAYLFSENIVTVQTELNGNGSTTQRFEDLNGNGKKEDGELYWTTLDADKNGTVVAQGVKDEISNYVSSNIAKYKADNNCDDATATAALQREAAINIVYRNYTEDRRQIQNILTVWATASTVLEDFVGEARTAYYESMKGSDGLLVKTISGITTRKTSTFNGKDLGSEYDVLRIVVNGIDPKAEYNFAFAVAPLSYYSGEYKGVNYAAEADGVTKFGVDMGNKDFFDKVVSATEKNGLPVGAGAYKATTSTGGEADRSSFFSNNIVYFQRNDNFTTVGSGINNAKIKYINYKVLSDDRIMGALTTKSIDLGTPNATPTNSGEVAQNSSYLASQDYRTGGYGYVGINPKFIPEIYVRQALMKAMDTTQTLAFYGTRYSEPIYRPVSTTSWSYTLGYPGGLNSRYVSETFDSTYDTSDDRNEIAALMTRAGYVIEDGIYTKRRTVSGIANAAIGTKMKLTFTLAGETTDHPAYSMFNATRDALNQMGFDITVTPDIQALKKLNSGNLAVWAAAWSSSTDPDMYQVYHMNSNTTSVNNKNYKNILNDTTTWAYEYNLISTLSGLIEDAREMDDQGTRASIYAQCYDLVMELAVELPTYQRSDLCVYNKEVIDANSLVKNPSYIIGLFDKLWEIDYVK